MNAESILTRMLLSRRRRAPAMPRAPAAAVQARTPFCIKSSAATDDDGSGRVTPEQAFELH